MPFVVGSASGIQDLAIDLLAYSRFADEPAEADLSVLSGGSFMD